MKRILLIGIVFLLCLFSVSAYDINETLTINAEYREDGVLTSSDAKIEIFDNENDLVLPQTNMTTDGVGLFSYNYLIPSQEGEYKASVKFFTGTKLLGTSEQFFTVGDENNLKFGVCPTGNTGITLLIVGFIVLIFLAVMGMIYSNAGLTFFAAIMLIFLSLTTWDCGQVLGILTIVAGVTFLIISAKIS